MVPGRDRADPDRPERAGPQGIDAVRSRARRGTGARGTSWMAVPAVRARLDVVFGAPIEVPAGGRSRAALGSASEKLREALTTHHASVRRRFGTGPGAGAGDGQDAQTEETA